MAPFVVRQSKFRHLFGDCSIREPFQDIRATTKSTEGCGVQGNEKYVALPWDTAGARLVVLQNDKSGRVGHSCPMLNNKSPVLDFGFSPFNPDIVTTAGEDGNLRVWNIPEGGLQQNMEEPEAVLTGHLKRVQLMAYHPCVDGLIATASPDLTARFWDVNAEQEISSIHIGEGLNLTHSLGWRYDGSLLAMTNQDKKVRIFDPRKPKACAYYTVAEGVKPSKMCWAGTNRFLTTGFTTSAERKMSVWDIRKEDQPVNSQILDNSSGTILPFFDPATGLVFLAGKVPFSFYIIFLIT